MWRQCIAFERLRQAFAPDGVHPMSKHRDRRPRHLKFQLRRNGYSFTIPLSVRCRRVRFSNLSTQLRRKQGLHTESLRVPATVSDPTQSLNLEQISPATIAHYTVYETT